jgi:phosphate-selective porin OprO/OprP
MSVNRSAGSDLDFSGWYASAGVFLTGETRDYSNSRGVIGGPRHIKHRWGALEAAVRYGTLDLEDQDVTGGKEDNLALALNWYVNDNVRLMLNYINFDASPTSTGVDEDGDIIAVRLQLVL